MMTQTFVIRSLLVQDAVMILSLGVVLFLFIFFLAKKKPRNIVVCFLWILLVLWFFNSRFFGFSAVTVGPSGIQVRYGILSWRDTVLPLGTPWRIKDRFSGIRKTERLYFLQIGGHDSMKVRGRKDLELLQAAGKAIDRFNPRGKTLSGGSTETRRPSLMEQEVPGPGTGKTSQGLDVSVFLTGLSICSWTSPTRQLFRSHVETPNLGRI